MHANPIANRAEVVDGVGGNDEVSAFMRFL